LGGADDPKLRDWYPAVVGDVPLYLARICWVEQLR
jgi:hypothetical protein